MAFRRSGGGGGLKGAAAPPTPNAPAVIGGDAASGAPINPLEAQLKTQRGSPLMGGRSHLQEEGGTSLLGGGDGGAAPPAEQSPNTDKEIHTVRADEQNGARGPRLTGSDG